MIPENIKQLLMSSDKEDVALGLVIARKKRIPIKELDNLIDWIMENDTDLWVDTFDVYTRYLLVKSDDEHYSYVRFYRWRKHE